MATNTYVALDKVTVGTATPSITFTNISGTYTDLVIVMSPATTHTLATFPYVRFNGDSGSNYSYTEVNGNGTSATTFRDINQTIGWTSPQMASISNTLGDNTTIVNIMNYSNSTTNKTYLSRANRAGSTLDYQGVETAVGLWRNTAAITSILIGNRRGGVDYNFAVGSTFSLYGIRTEGVSPAAKATGGAIYADSTYYYHVFSASGTFTPTQSITADCLVVAGGAGGGRSGGGGGAGGLLAFTSQSLTATGYTITVGSGGAGNNVDGQTGTAGGDSQFAALTLVKGGGGGGSYNANGASGASGGGGGSFEGSIKTGGSATPSGQGNAGGNGFNGTLSTNRAGGGGGGAGTIGAAGTSAVGGNGGTGSTTYSSWGIATGVGQNISGTYYLAGGGGGYGSTTGGTGGSGGGGAKGVNGMPNTGGGGGGSASDGTVGFNGGSGVVIIRYAK